MPPKCKVRKTLPAIGLKGCNAKAEEPLGSKAAPAAKAAPAQAPIVRYTRLSRIQRHATRNIKLIRDENKALRINKIIRTY